MKRSIIMEETRECDAGTLTFKGWMKKVNELLIATTDLDSLCYFDIAYWDLWDLGGEPCEAAQEAIWETHGEIDSPIVAEYLALHGEMQ
jgi:hypothetical protein